MGVIVTDGNERATLAVTRSLGRRGVPVYVGAESPRSLAGTSRYCAGSFQYPSPWDRPDEYVSCILEQARLHDIELVYPMTDLAVELLGHFNELAIPPFHVPIPSLRQYHALSDKFRLLQWAQQHHIPIPPTFFISDDRIGDIISSIPQWPVVVKPGRSLLKIGNYFKRTKVQYANNPIELRRMYLECEELRCPFLVQSRVVGEGQGIFGLFIRGEARALFAHRRIRERPPSGGVSVLRESIALPAPTTRYALQIAEAAAWDGVAMMEFKVDRDLGTPFLMEVNGRFWGSLQLAVDAGVDFPWLLYQLSTTGSIGEMVSPYRIGVRSRWFIGDCDHLLLRWWKSERELALPPGSPSRWMTLLNFVNVLDPNTKAEVFRPSDPKPGLHELENYCRSLIRGVGSALGRRLSNWRGRFTRAIWDMGLLAGVHRRVIRFRFPQSVTRVLVLCKGNLCRSPFVDRWFYGKLSEMNIPIEISSAGLDTTPGKEAYPLATVVSRDFGIDLGCHRTRMVSNELVMKADVILVMEVAHIRQLLKKFPDAGGKTFLLGHFAQEKPITDIRDPYGGTPEEFYRCYRCLVEACQGLLVQLQAKAKPLD